MSENDFEEMEKFLLPFAQSRYQAKSGIAKFAMKIAGKRIQTMVTWQVRAFIRCIYLVNEPIMLQDVTFIVISELSVMMHFPPYNATGIIENRAEMPLSIGAEIHRWFIHLIENDMLPGTYERFTGRFVPNANA